MTATTYVTQNAAVVAGTATVDSGESITGDIVLDSKTQLQILLPTGDSGSPLAGDQTFISFQVQAFADGDWSEAADAAGRLLAPQAFDGGRAPVPDEVAGAYAIRIRYGTASAPLDQDAERAIQFVASSPASATVAPDPYVPSGLTPKFKKIDAASSGNNTIVAAVVGKKIRVIAADLVCVTAVTVAWQSGAGGTALSGTMSFGANGGYVLGYNPAGWFETAAQELLNMSLGGAVQVSGTITYIEV